MWQKPAQTKKQVEFFVGAWFSVEEGCVNLYLKEVSGKHTCKFEIKTSARLFPRKFLKFSSKESQHKYLQRFERTFCRNLLQYSCNIREGIPIPRIKNNHSSNQETIGIESHTHSTESLVLCEKLSCKNTSFNKLLIYIVYNSTPSRNGSLILLMFGKF